MCRYRRTCRRLSGNGGSARLSALPRSGPRRLGDGDGGVAPGGAGARPDGGSRTCSTAPSADPPGVRVQPPTPAADLSRQCRGSHLGRPELPLGPRRHGHRRRPSGRHVGRKLLYVQGFVAFVIDSVLCGLAPSLGILIACRVLQAVGAAMLQVNSVPVIVIAVPRSSLGKAIGIKGAARHWARPRSSVGGLLPAVGGRRLLFMINVPFGMLGVLAGLAFIPPQPQTQRAGALRLQRPRPPIPGRGGGAVGPAGSTSADTPRGIVVSSLIPPRVSVQTS